MSTAAAGFTRYRSGITPWRVIIRALWPCEHEHFLRHLLRLDGPTRSERFGRGVSDDWIARYAAETDWLRGTVLGCWIDGTLRGAAELRRYGSGASRTGETALSIEPAFQNHGLGSLLSRRIVVIARNRGIATLCMLVAAGNWRMRSIAQKLGARMALAGGQIEAELTLGPGTVATLAEERASASAAPLSQVCRRQPCRGRQGCVDRAGTGLRHRGSPACHSRSRGHCAMACCGRRMTGSRPLVAATQRTNRRGLGRYGRLAGLPRC